VELEIGYTLKPLWTVLELECGALKAVSSNRTPKKLRRMEAMTTATLAEKTRMPSTPVSTIQVYNTLTKRKEPFQTVRPGKVGIYLCGPTVYKEAHIGHMVGPVIFDTIKRYLQYSGYEVTWVVNITDVDDKLIQQQHERGIPMADIAAEMTVDYLNNLRALGVDQIDHMPKATEHMGDIIEFTQSLIDQGFAYAADGDVFFDVARNSGYGKLSNRSAEEQQGEGGLAGSRKRSPGDFALWKSAKPGEPAWDSPWGKGRPGWHIECSAMSRAILGETFDIHGGGLDLLFPHHENEKCQSECRHGKPMVKYWMHNGLLRKSEAGKIGGKSDRDAEQGKASKMSRSEGAGGLADVIAKHGADRIRFLLVRTHYRSTVVFGDEGFAEVTTALETFYRFFERFQAIARQRFYNLPGAKSRQAGDFDPGHEPLLQAVHAGRASFLAKMDDDFNTGGAIADLFDIVRELNKYCDQQKLDDLKAEGDAKQVYYDSRVKLLVRTTCVLRELTAVLGLFRFPPTNRGGGDGLTPKLMDLLIAMRQEARAKKDFPLSDRIRNGLTEIGVTLEDRKEGTIWRAGQ
jgi:cysteinyl-tRNA synthetase